MKKALLVVDMQNVCVGENHANVFKYDNKALIKEVNAIIGVNGNNEVVYILNIMKRNLINKVAPFKAYEGSDEIKLVKELLVVSENSFVKYKGDAFSNTQLNIFLQSKGIDTVEIIGVDGGGCVSMTALGAIKNGYKVILNTRGIGTSFEKQRDKLYSKLVQQGAEII